MTTTGQQAATEIRRICHVYPRTRTVRAARVMEMVTEAVTIRGYHSDATTAAVSPAWAAVCSIAKHIDGYRSAPAVVGYVHRLSVYQFTNLIADMVDSGVTNVGEGERYFQTLKVS